MAPPRLCATPPNSYCGCVTPSCLFVQLHPAELARALCNIGASVSGVELDRVVATHARLLRQAGSTRTAGSAGDYDVVNDRGRVSLDNFTSWIIDLPGGHGDSDAVALTSLTPANQATLGPNATATAPHTANKVSYSQWQQVGVWRRTAAVRPMADTMCVVAGLVFATAASTVSAGLDCHTVQICQVPC